MSNRIGPRIGNNNTEIRGPADVSYAYAYNNDSHQKRTQPHRSSTISSNGETPMKYKTTRKPNMVSNVERTNLLENSPLFLDRLLDGEVQDFREFTRIIEKQNREIVGTEKYKHRNGRETRTSDTGTNRVGMYNRRPRKIVE
jgi:hypothetical protein